MSDAIYPSGIQGLAWPVVRTPAFATIVQKAASGREVRVAEMQTPIYRWTLGYDYLSAADRATLQGFLLQRQGMFDSFLFDDPDDDSVSGQAIGAGDGATTNFPLVRTYGGFSEQVDASNAISAVYVNGTATTAYSLQNQYAYPSVLFTAAPASGAAITADFTYYFRVRFGDDSYDFEEFLYQFHTVSKISLTRAKL